MANLPKRHKIGAGKWIGGCLYLHRDHVDLLPDDCPWESCWNQLTAWLLPQRFDEWNILKWNTRTQAVTFIHSPDFDTAAEPIVGRSYHVRDGHKPRGRNQAADPEIYHHKFLMVTPTSQRFDVAESQRRSERWLKIPTRSFTDREAITLDHPRPSTPERN